MNGFRVVYRQGSFRLADPCETREQALARARTLMAGNGVWHVRVEDSLGNPVLERLEGDAERAGAGLL